MKLKIDENGHVVVQDDKPVYVYDDGREIAFDAPANMAKIAQLNTEAKNHRTAKEQAEALLKAFDGIDAQKARQAIETVKNLDDKKLIDAGEVEKVKAEAKRAFDEQLAKVHQERDDITKQYHDAMISGEFARSKYISDKTILPSDIMQAQFGRHFSIDKDGRLIGKYDDGNPIYSPTNGGDYASFDEAIEAIIARYPHKETILRGSGASGAGAGQPNNNQHQVMKRGEMSAEQKAQYIKEHGQQAYLDLPK